MLKFYGNLFSSNTQKVRYFLAETGIPFDYQAIDLAAGEQLQASFLALNPLGMVPAVEVDGHRLAESNTILRYLAQRYGKTDWYPVNLEDQSRVDQAMDFVTAHINRQISTIHWNKVIAPLLRLPVNEAAIGDAQALLLRALPRFERHMASTTAYLCGKHPTIADAAFAPLAAQSKQLGISLTDYPLTHAYVDRLLARPAWHTVATEIEQMMK